MSDKVVKRRTRVWTCIVYPESLPSNWQDILIDVHTNIVVSPLHDKDINPDGTPKKPHYHILFDFDGVKSFDQVKEISDKLNGTIPQVCNNIKGMVRYFIHMDNPEKAPYPKELIICYGYFDLNDYFKITYTERYLIFADMIDYIKNKKVREYSDFVDYCRIERLNDWFPILVDCNTTLITSYIRSNSFREQDRQYEKNAKRAVEAVNHNTNG